jgi:hypothetical protein
VSGSELVDERLPLGIELADLGFDVRDDSIDRDEERELSVAQRVEHLTVVAACPYVLAVRYQRQGGDVLTRFHQVPERTADASQAQARVEQRRDHA